jgi:hypothetical protein
METTLKEFLTQYKLNKDKKFVFTKYENYKITDINNQIILKFISKHKSNNDTSSILNFY